MIVLSNTGFPRLTESALGRVLLWSDCICPYQHTWGGEIDPDCIGANKLTQDNFCKSSNFVCQARSECPRIRHCVACTLVFTGSCPPGTAQLLIQLGPIDEATRSPGPGARGRKGQSNSPPLRRQGRSGTQEAAPGSDQCLPALRRAWPRHPRHRRAQIGRGSLGISPRGLRPGRTRHEGPIRFTAAAEAGPDRGPGGPRSVAISAHLLPGIRGPGPSSAGAGCIISVQSDLYF
ncbi:hypothetical protein NDU88_001290 [Pleurodeles waltl]|uniref:Uncharacterized protein n=1 Tax=Pleurodeles waltl TaxID=8319 RepID=A0AAV7Q5K6_PLEWA|nr:hypothetical protein NDU88_001290 [Pleurodeles waltl]